MWSAASSSFSSNTPPSSYAPVRRLRQCELNRVHNVLSARKESDSVAVCTVEYGGGGETAEVTVDITWLGQWADHEIGMWDEWGKTEAAKYTISRRAVDSPDTTHWYNSRPLAQKYANSCHERWQRVRSSTFADDSTADEIVEMDTHVLVLKCDPQIPCGSRYPHVLPERPQCAYLIDNADPVFSDGIVRRHGGSRDRMMSWLLDSYPALMDTRPTDVLVYDYLYNWPCSYIFKTMYITGW